VSPTPGTDDPRLRPAPLEIGMSVAELLDRAFLGSTAGGLAQATRLLAERPLSRPGIVLGLTMDAALMPGGVAVSTLVPLIQGGYVDWIATTGENLFLDALFALGLPFYTSVPPGDDGFEQYEGDVFLRRADREKGEERLREILSSPEFQSVMGTAALHDRLGAHLRVHEKNEGVAHPSLLTTAHELDVPVFNPAPADNPLGTLIANLTLVGNRLSVDASADLSFVAALLNSAAAAGQETALWCLGRGSAASFALQAPRHLETVLGGRKPTGYAARVRMAGRAHSVHPHEAIETPGAVDLALSTDLSVAMPLMTAYLLDRVPPRPLKRFGARREDLIDRLRQDQLAATLARAVPKRA
jgi:deoxyhypusine synthase